MALLKIIKYGDCILRVNCKRVLQVDDNIRKILGDMVFTMHASEGVGLAAPQVGLDMRLIVVDIGEGAIKLVNPEIISRQGSSLLEEGCLSLPNLHVKVKRAKTIKVSGLDEDGNKKVIEAKDLLSHVLQHEIDHLNGRLLIDYLPFYRRFFLRRQLLRE